MTVKWVGFVEKLSDLGHLQSMLPNDRRIHWYHDKSSFREAVNQAGHAVVLLHAGSTHDIYDMCQELTARSLCVSVILLGPASQLDLKQAMRMGAVDAVGIPFTADEWQQAVQAAEQRLNLKYESQEQEKDAKGRVITICGTKGGIGKTTVTVNLGITFTKHELKVAIVDLDLQFGDAAILLDLKPKQTIYQLVKECQGDFQHISPYLVHHSSGLDLLSAPLRPEYAEEIQGEHIASIIETLRTHYDIVLIDTPPSLMETSLVAMEHSTDILLITSMELPTLKNSKLGIETLETLGLKEKTKVVLNRDSNVEGLRLTSVEDILGTAIYARIPSEGNIVVPSINQGIPFVISHTRAAVSRSIFSLAGCLLGKKNPEPVARKESLSILSRIIGKKAGGF